MKILVLVMLWVAVSASIVASATICAAEPRVAAVQNNIQPVSSSTAAVASSHLEQLENKKLMLEVQKLEEDLSSWNTNLLIQVGTMIAAFVAVFISGRSATKTLRQQLAAMAIQNSNHKRDRVSVLLKELGSDNALVRAASIQALSEYADAIPFLINALKSEKNPSVLDSTILALNSHPDLALTLLLKQSEQIYRQKLSFASALTRLGAERKEVSREFGLRNRDVKSWQESGAGRRLRGAAASVIDDFDSGNIGFSNVESARIRMLMSTAFQAHANCLLAMESLFRVQSVKGKAFNLSGSYLSGLELDGMDLSYWDFSNCILDRASFRDCDCTKTSFVAIKANDICFGGSRMHSTNFDGAEVENIDLRKIKGIKLNFSNSDIRNARIDRADIDDAIFTRAKLFEVDIRNSNMRRVQFSEAKLFSSTIDTCRLSDSCFSDAKFTSVNLRSLRCRRADFSGTEFDRVVFYKGDFSNCSFNEAKWIRARVRLSS